MNTRKYQVNEYFFNEINNEEKSYILGILYSDGCVYHNSMIINLSHVDEEILDKIKKIMEYNGPLYHQKEKIYICNGREIKNGNMSRLQITSKQIIKDLNKWGVIERKSKLLKSLPELKTNLLRHFIRGYIDGDGGFSLRNNCKGMVCSIVGTKYFLTKIQKYLRSNKINSNKIIKHNRMFYLRICKYWDLKRLYTLLYTGSDIFLKRKKEFLDNYYTNIPEKRICGTSRFKGVFYNKYDKNWTVIFRGVRVGSSKDEGNAYILFKTYENKWLKEGLQL